MQAVGRTVRSFEHPLKGTGLLATLGRVEGGPEGVGRPQGSSVDSRTSGEGSELEQGTQESEDRYLRDWGP